MLVASLATDLFQEKIDFDQFLLSIPDEAMEDEDISDLVDLIEHEPKQNGIFGVSADLHSAHLAAIKNLIEKLKE